jgi:ferric-dicitrate binding protein FerR (iron transport regulator)
MTDSKYDDLIWQTAVDWVIREHEAPFDTATRQALVTWLKGDPARRRAYEEASDLWLLTGLVPPAVNNEHEDDSPAQRSESFPDL